MATIYKMVKQNGGTDRFGLCECCKKSVDVMHTLYSADEVKARDGRGVLVPRPGVFGHKTCLAAITEVIQ